MEKWDYGIAMSCGGKSVKFYFTDDQHWLDDDSFSVTAVTETGAEALIAYEPPVLERLDGECDSDYSDRCVEATDWLSPLSIEVSDPSHPRFMEAVYSRGDYATFAWID